MGLYKFMYNKFRRNGNAKREKTVYNDLIADAVPTGWFVLTSVTRRRSRVIPVCPKQINQVFLHCSVSVEDRVVAFQITHFADYLLTLFASR